MNKINAQTSEQKRKKKILILLFIFIFLLIIIWIVLRMLLFQENQNQLPLNERKTVEQILNYYECHYISEKESQLKDYRTDIYLKFRYPLYDGDVSYETFFNRVIQDIAKVLSYENFRMIDEEQEIEIKVMCKNNSIETIIINDIEDYFIYMDSQKEIANYVEIEKTKFQIDAPEIQNLVENYWSNQLNFGTRESIFDSYYEYFDEGIKTRTISGKIYNIIFTTNYQGSVINGIFPGVDLQSIETKLGNPTFQDKDKNVIGYKGEEIYVFFTPNEISVYRATATDTDDFFDLVDRFLEDELDLLDFMNELTYIWPDYSEYIYSTNSAFISYPLKGVDVKIGYDHTNGIVLYNNVNANLDKVQRYLKNTEFIANLGIDNVFEAEKRRVENTNNLHQKCVDYQKTLNEKDRKIIGESSNFEVFTQVDSNQKIMKLYFVSKNKDYPNRELSDNIGTFLWIDNDAILYSQEKKGIYYYNVANGEKKAIIKGEETYQLKGFDNGTIQYDNTQIQFPQ